MEERELNGLIIGHENFIDFNNLYDYNDRHAFTFHAIQSRDNTYLALIYRWANKISKTYNDHEEAFYIANISKDQLEMAKEILFRVYVKIRNSFSCDNFKIFDLSSCVDEVLSDYQKRVK